MQCNQLEKRAKMPDTLLFRLKSWDQSSRKRTMVQKAICPCPSKRKLCYLSLTTTTRRATKPLSQSTRQLLCLSMADLKITWSSRGRMLILQQLLL